MPRKLYFEPLISRPSRDVARLLKHLAKAYETGGPATHIAFPEGTGEIVVAYPLRSDGTRFVAVVSPFSGNRPGWAKSLGIEKTPWLDEVDEFELEYTDEQLENGIPTHLSLV